MTLRNERTNATCCRVTILRNGACRIFPVRLRAYRYCACVNFDSCCVDIDDEASIQWIVDTWVVPLLDNGNEFVIICCFPYKCQWWQNCAWFCSPAWKLRLLLFLFTIPETGVRNAHCQQYSCNCTSAQQYTSLKQVKDKRGNKIMLLCSGFF